MFRTLGSDNNNNNNNTHAGIDNEIIANSDNVETKLNEKPHHLKYHVKQQSERKKSLKKVTFSLKTDDDESTITKKFEEITVQSSVCRSHSTKSHLKTVVVQINKLSSLSFIDICPIKINNNKNDNTHNNCNDEYVLLFSNGVAWYSNSSKTLDHYLTSKPTRVFYTCVLYPSKYCFLLRVEKNVLPIGSTQMISQHTKGRNEMERERGNRYIPWIFKQRGSDLGKYTFAGLQHKMGSPFMINNNNNHEQQQSTILLIPTSTKQDSQCLFTNDRSNKDNQNILEATAENILSSEQTVENYYSRQSVRVKTNEEMPVIIMKHLQTSKSQTLSYMTKNTFNNNNNNNVGRCNTCTRFAFCYSKFYNSFGTWSFRVIFILLLVSLLVCAYLWILLTFEPCLSPFAEHCTNNIEIPKHCQSYFV
jgi:hypothetical protein